VCIARRDEVKIAGEPEALVRCFDELELPVGRIGLEVCPSTQWLDPGLVAAVRLRSAPLNSDPTSFPETPDHEIV